MAAICGCGPEISWQRVEATAKYLTSPKPYLKVGETASSWGRYILPSLTSECEGVAAFIKSFIAPFVLLETVSATCKLRAYTLDVQNGKYTDFAQGFIQGAIAVGAFVAKGFKSVTWLNKMQAIVLKETIVFRLGVISSLCSFTKASLELFMKSFELLEVVSAGDDPSQEDAIKCMKALIETVLHFLSLWALYQATAIGAFLSVLFGTCATVMDFV